MKKLISALFSRRALRAYAWIFVSMLTMLLLLRQYVGWSGTKRWLAVQAELVKEGESIDFRKVSPEPVPDDQNFCAIPLLKDLAATPDSKDDKSAAGLNRQRIVAVALPKNDKAGQRPGFGQSAALGSRMDVQAWAEWLRKEGSLPLPPDSGDPAKDILTALGKHDALINELAAGLNRPEAQWTPPWKTRTLPGNLFEVPLPHYSVIRELTQMLSFRSIVATRAGDATKAHEALLIAIRLQQATMQEPFLIGLLVAASNSLAINLAVWEICDAQLGTVEDFRRLQDALAKMDYRKSALLAWRSELAGSSSALTYLKQSRDTKMLAMVNEGGSSAGGVAGALFTHLLPDGWFDANAATVVKWNLDFSIKPLRDAGFKEMMLKQNELTNIALKQCTGLTSRFANTVALMIVPATTSVSRNVVYAQALASQAVTACALERYRIEHGRYPVTLAEAMGGEKAMPQDVLSGAPMGYRKKNEGRYALWSVGFDGKDDGGKRVLDEKKPENTKFRDVKYAGDWVWDYPAK
ncbi:MAG: hypothetical protein RL693_1335 [Verrucomicrobiota bacterium]|jgi:hypothetical protein